MVLPLDQIQGNITPGFRKDHQAFLFFQWENTLRDIGFVRAWIKAIRPYIASAKEVATFNKAFSLVKKRLPKQESSVLHATWVNVGFSRRGLSGLISDGEFERFPSEFIRTPNRGIEMDDETARASFEFGGSVETMPDAIVIIGADTVSELESEIVRQIGLARNLSLMLPPYIGQSLGNHEEHFGFRDGISQPDPADPLCGWDPDWSSENVVAPGEFILGQPREPTTDAMDRQEPQEPLWAHNGSYLVFRKLQQQVHLFEQEVQEAVDAIELAYSQGAAIGHDETRLLSGITKDLMRAKLMGRWPSGIKLSGYGANLPSRDPVDGYRSSEDVPKRLKDITVADVEADGDGEQCPFFAHIRKSNPRTGPEVRSRRIIRRSITYGPPSADRTVDDGQERGIFFLAYQASIERQFEFIQRTWLNDEATAGNVLENQSPLATRSGPDPIVGIRSYLSQNVAPARHNSLQLREGEAFERIRFPTRAGVAQPVIARGSGYFFTPSIDAIAMLGG
jgi:Dyp-type peroxidase family